MKDSKTQMGQGASANSDPSGSLAGTTLEPTDKTDKTEKTVTRESTVGGTDSGSSESQRQVAPETADKTKETASAPTTTSRATRREVTSETTTIMYFLLPQDVKPLDITSPDALILAGAQAAKQKCRLVKATLVVS